MLNKILVPTDGSELSERAIPVAEDLAVAQAAHIVLVTVVAPPAITVMASGGELDPDLYSKIVEAEEDVAVRLLDRLANHARSRGICARSLLLHDSPIHGLLNAQATQKPDFVVMATHGRTGFTRFARGSVSDSLLRDGTTPILMVPSFGKCGGMTRALVPLDGSPLAEAVLPRVEALAGRPLQHVDLLGVVEPQQRRSHIGTYLRSIADRLSLAHVSVSVHVRFGRPSEAIAGLAEGADLVMMSTHGRGGFSRLRNGSVAEELLRMVGVPMFLVRGDTGASRAVPENFPAARVA